MPKGYGRDYWYLEITMESQVGDMPREIRFRIRDENGSPQVVTKPLEESTLNELTAAITLISEELESIESEKAALLYIQKRASRYASHGGVSLSEALFGPPAEDELDVETVEQ